MSAPTSPGTPGEELAAQVRQALIRAGLSIHDLDAPDGSPAAMLGGVDIVPPSWPLDPGVLVLWAVHDEIAIPAVEAEDADRFDDSALILDRRIRVAMHNALKEILLASGFNLEIHRPPRPAIYVTGRAKRDDQ